MKQLKEKYNVESMGINKIDNFSINNSSKDNVCDSRLSYSYKIKIMITQKAIKIKTMIDTNMKQCKDNEE